VLLSRHSPPILGQFGVNDNIFMGALPSEIGQLSRLEYLYCDVNELSGVLPSEIGLLTNLVEIFVNENEISGSLPTEIGKLGSLHVLSLSLNPIAEIGRLSNLGKCFI
jgi:Leucine-rich repeat (LRR) protein